MEAGTIPASASGRGVVAGDSMSWSNVSGKLAVASVFCTIIHHRVADDGDPEDLSIFFTALPNASPFYS
jgi:hypothetical protein